MQVNFFATLREITGKKTVDFILPEGATIRQLVDEIIRLYPEIGIKLLNEDGQLYGHVHLLINGRDYPYLENALDTELQADDVVNIFPAVGGG